MPGDGACLFHSLAHGLATLGHREDGFSVRRRIALYIKDRADSEIAGTPLRSWVEWESHSNVETYTAQLAGGGLWGGAIEMAVAAQVYNVDVAVFEEDAQSRGFFRISDFRTEQSPQGAVLVLYLGRSHYDALVVFDQDAERQRAYQYASHSRGQRYHSSPEEEEEEWCSVM